MIQTVPNAHGVFEGITASEYDGTSPRSIWTSAWYSATLSRDGRLATITSYNNLHDSIFILDTKTGIVQKAIVPIGGGGPALVTSDMKYLAYLATDSSGTVVVIEDMASNVSHSVRLASQITTPFFDTPNLSWNEATNQLVCSDGINGFVLSNDGVVLRTIPMAANPEWSPDGKSLVWDQNGSIMMSNNAGATSVTLIPKGQYPHWSSHSSYLAYRDSTIKILLVGMNSITDTRVTASQAWLW
jgi:DNA-binding beta-propeller fold protein YncE